jgi:thiosulfate dehydrogenase (quinone) large subunit
MWWEGGEPDHVPIDNEIPHPQHLAPKESVSQMSTTAPRVEHPELDVVIPVEDEAQAYKARHLMAITRISLAWVFLWAFLDKTFGLGFATASENAWVNGGSPTYGFLTFGTEGTIFQSFFSGLTGPVADWLFMIGLLGIGLALLLGIGMRIAAVSGALMMVLMWAAVLPLANNPFMDDHLVYALVLGALAVFGAGRYWGLGRRWESLAIVQRFPILK